MMTRAAVCRIGHVVSEDIEASPPRERCRLCGATVWTVCPSCEAPLPGLTFTMVQAGDGSLVRRLTSTAVLAAGDSPHCPQCNQPYPWSFGHRGLGRPRSIA